MKIKIYSKSVIGENKKNNQDHYFWTKNNDQQILIGITDGVGSYEQSHLVSKMVGQVIQKNFMNQNFQNWNETKIKDWLKSIIEDEINKKIRKISEKVATTLSLIIIKEDKSYFCHIGNTRIYQFDEKKEKMFLLTEDHEFQNQTEDTFMWITGNKFLKNAISNYNSCYIDIEEVENKNGYLMLTTDGLHDFVEQHFLYETINNKKYDEKEKIELFFEKAKFAGSLDDITCLLIKIN